MKIHVRPMFLLASLLLAGCATSTVATRTQERAAAYAQLSPQSRNLVDQGQIKVGMPKDAVYIAWGKPSEVIQGESPSGPIETWLYYGSYVQEYPYWRYNDYWYRGRYFMGAPYIDYDYYPQYYVRGDVTFENGLVKSWRARPRTY